MMHVIRACTFCAGDTGEFSENTTVLLNITSVSIATTLCEIIVGLCS